MSNTLVETSFYSKIFRHKMEKFSLNQMTIQSKFTMIDAPFVNFLTVYKE